MTTAMIINTIISLLTGISGMNRKLGFRGYFPGALLLTLFFNLILVTGLALQKRK